ncbi:aromatic ring-hydroxylating oxygenase subunit alpha [Streptomyces puniciscabiei]
MRTSSEIRDLITDDWRVHGSIYRDAGVFARETARIFGRSWVYLAHESQIPEPGDYTTTHIGLQPVIVSRGVDDGEIHAMLNRCRHRAALVCGDDAGNAAYFRCPYHGWTYTNTGTLRGVTYDGAYDCLPREQLGLVKVSRVASFKGFVFGSLAPEGPGLEEHLGNARRYIDLVAQQGPNGIELTAGAHRVAYDGNWKLQVENTIDNYHFGFVHRSFLDILADRLGSTPPIVSNIVGNPEWRNIDLGQGHSVHEFGDPLRGGGNNGQLGDLPFNLIVFPNLCFVGAQVRHILPKGPTRTEVVLHPMLYKGAPSETNAAILRAHEGFYGAAGFGGPDDVEVAFDRVHAGLAATEDDWLVMSRGAHREVPGEGGTRTGHATDELPQRAFYRGWLAAMTEGDNT